ncbi:hypothetical protein [Pseudonocardia sp. T1-2H]|uniref:hypothetical protein n=1 Tax=Pseudonocardia sp. T1-2H TaxID=3128899 RepID=UPI0031018E5F
MFEFIAWCFVALWAVYVWCWNLAPVPVSLLTASVVMEILAMFMYPRDRGGMVMVRVLVPRHRPPDRRPAYDISVEGTEARSAALLREKPVAPVAPVIQFRRAA